MRAATTPPALGARRPRTSKDEGSVCPDTAVHATLSVRVFRVKHLRSECRWCGIPPSRCYGLHTAAQLRLPSQMPIGHRTLVAQGRRGGWEPTLQPRGPGVGGSHRPAAGAGVERIARIGEVRPRGDRQAGALGGCVLTGLWVGVWAPVE
jgi:hypothetical protein